MPTVLKVLVFAVGAACVLGTVGSAVRTVVLPRGVPAKLTGAVFTVIRGLFKLRIGRAPSYDTRDRIMAVYGPLSLLVLAAVWLVNVAIGFAAMYWALGTRPVGDAAVLSGSSLLTLGFIHPEGGAQQILSVVEAALGLTLLALLITYLPSLYGAFSRREAAVAHLEVRAGSPPSGVEMLQRLAAIGWLDRLTELWDRWEGWFLELEETHTSFPALVHFRSPLPEHSWITAAGAVLDAASLRASTLEGRDPDAEVLIRAGYLSLRRIADYFKFPYDPDPAPDDPITISREEFDEAYDRLASAGVDLVQDRDEAWRHFAGWRVNYDTVLVTLAGFVMAPYAPWSSDRSAAGRRPKVLRRGRRWPR